MRSESGDSGVRRLGRRRRRPMGAAVLIGLVLIMALSGCCGLVPMLGGDAEPIQPSEEEPAAAEPTEVDETPTPQPTQAAIAPPDVAPTAIGSPTPLVVEAAPDAAETEALGRLDVEYPVRLATKASDTVILHLSMPELLAAAEPVAVVRVEEAEPVSANLGRFDAVVYLAPRMRAELTAPALTIETLTAVDQDVELVAIDAPTTWAWTVQAPDTPGKQVMTLRLFRVGDDMPLWIGSLRVDITDAGALTSSLGDDSARESSAPAPAEVATAPAQPTTTPGLIAGVVQALTQDVTGLVLGVLSLIGSIIAAVLAAWVERGGSLKRSDKRTLQRHASGHSRTGLGSTLRALWFRIREGSRKR